MKQVATLCMGFIVAATGLPAASHAAVVEYNPAVPFVWTPQVAIQVPPFFTPPNAFDVTQPPIQSGAIMPLTVYQTTITPTGSSQPVDLNWTSGGSVSFAVTPVANFSGFIRPGPQSSPQTYSAPREYLNGQMVDAGATYAPGVTVGWTNGFQSFRRDYDTVVFTPPSTITHIVVSIPNDFVIGLKVTAGDGDHFGWIAVHWVNEGRGRYDIASWAYETNANTPIAVPAPTIGGIAALGLLTALRRRRPQALRIAMQ